jgi:hypothetical protein
MKKKTAEALIALSHKTQSCEQCFAQDFKVHIKCQRCGRSPLERVTTTLDQLVYQAVIQVFGEQEARRRLG